MRKWLPLVTVCLGTFILLIDVTIVNVALPNMVGDLGASFGALQWVDECTVGLGEVDGVVAGSGSDVQDPASGERAEDVVARADTVPEAPSQLFRYGRQVGPVELELAVGSPGLRVG
ncbi:hypothetical protein ACFYW8_37725 [Streptomyces sp. NPDC002742]|uniref:hypothetical protein n=1 Tax=Streptomyces sp. NPDC002742 TaxID=3364663 RepID=UPI0036C9CD6B